MDILHSIRISLLLAFMALPLILMSFTGFLALALGNLGLFILFIGQAALIPTVTFGLHIVTNLIGFANHPGSDVGQLVPSEPYTGYQNVTPSYWAMQVVFFLSYLLSNATQIYNLPVAPGASDWQVANRRSKAVAVIVVAAIALIMLPLLRYWYTGAETLPGLAIAGGVAGLLGWGWYKLASICGARASDIFGIIQQILPASATTPMTCVYTPSA
jgi:hypothetical protein